jgi:hypothetical protein
VHAASLARPSDIRLTTHQIAITSDSIASAAMAAASANTMLPGERLRAVQRRTG